MRLLLILLATFVFTGASDRRMDKSERESLERLKSYVARGWRSRELTKAIEGVLENARRHGRMNAR